MAKISGPLLSIGASGKIADTLVFSTWKGVKTARQLVVPSNPNSAAQQTQRGVMSDAVSEWKTAGITAADKTAWDLAALSAAGALSGFNLFCRKYITAIVAGDTWQTQFAGVASSVSTTGFVFTLSAAADLGGTLYIGTSTTSMLTSFAGVFDTDHYTYTITGLSASTKYYFYAKETDADKGGETGIYTQTTSAS